MNKTDTKPLVAIRQLSERFGIPKPTLRYWEKEFEGILVPERTAGGQRRYGSGQIAVIERIVAMKQDGVGLSEIRERLLAEEKSKDASDAGGFPEALADRIAEAVRREVIAYFQNEDRERRREEMAT